MIMSASAGFGSTVLVSALVFAMVVGTTPTAGKRDNRQRRDAASTKADEVDKAIDRAVKFLLDEQNRDGSICDSRQHRTAMTSLAVMSLAAVGHQPTDDTPEGRAMRNAIQYVLKPELQDKAGYFGNADGSRMYGHGIATLMLSEMLGMGVDEKMDQQIRDRLERAVTLILRAQKHRKGGGYEGGWRYTPDARDADLSLTVWQLMALRSAKNAGVEQAKQAGDAIEAAVEYLRRSYHSRRDSKGRATDLTSGFTYQPRRSDVRFSTTAMGLLAMQVCGYYDEPEVKGAANWLKRNPPSHRDRWFYYGMYYYAQGMYQRGGEFARDAEQRTNSLLLRLQEKRGSWKGSSSEAGAGRVYCTSMAVLSLSVKYHYLPIYQR